MVCFLCIVLGVVLVTFAQEKKANLPLPPEEDELVMRASIRCNEQTRAGKRIVQNLFMFRANRDTKTRDFLYCVFVSLDYATIEGHMTQKFLSLFDPHPYKNDVRYAFDLCKSEDHVKYADTLFEEISCFFEKSPVRLGEKFTE